MATLEWQSELSGASVGVTIVLAENEKVVLELSKVVPKPKYSRSNNSLYFVPDDFKDKEFDFKHISASLLSYLERIKGGSDHDYINFKPCHIFITRQMKLNPRKPTAQDILHDDSRKHTFIGEGYTGKAMGGLFVFNVIENPKPYGMLKRDQVCVLQDLKAKFIFLPKVIL